MVYAHELTGGEIVEHHLTRAPLHVETARIVSDPPTGAQAIVITGHHAHTGEPLTAEHSAALNLTEAKLTNLFVIYKGSRTDQHGLCRLLGPCLDQACINAAERRYALRTATGLELWHVREASFTAQFPICHHCGAIAGQLI
ncbi:hypothetical protein [Actinoplanes sp. NPDC051411]|uniref:hypothetical protein n=1 Tax=Actinoplanes sp. NPDC051411 TaxID=3155522 RepID=UPI0034273CFA